jgi:hypothetical protein
MAFAKARKPEQMTESVERHDNSALADFVMHAPTPVK